MSFRAWLTRLVAQPRSWVRAITHRRRLEDEMQAELTAHLEQLAEDFERQGLSATESRRQAGIAMGSLLTAKDDMRTSLGLASWDAMLADLRYAVRLLKKDLGFTSIAVLSLALAIGANTTIFSAAKQLLYDRLQVPDASQLRLLAWVGDAHRVAVHSSWGDWDINSGVLRSSIFSYPVYQQLRQQNRLLGDLFAFKNAQANAVVRGAPSRVSCELVSGNYYTEMRVRPILGRAILPADDAKLGDEESR